MPQLMTYALTFQGGLHIGTRGVTLEEAGVSIPSDTLFSALLHCWLLAGGNIEGVVATFNSSSEVPFLLTSAFPFAGDLRFFPIPVNFTDFFSDSTLEMHGKKLKKVRFFSEGLLEKALKSEQLDEWLFPAEQIDSNSKGLSLQGGALWLLQSETSKLPPELRIASDLNVMSLWKEARVPRVTIERITNASNIYQAGHVRFADACGLWFGIDWRKPEIKLSDGTSIKNAFDMALAVLEDEGLGGERSSGYGAFKSRVMGKAYEYREPSSDGMAYLLGRYIPHETELPDVLTDTRAAYELVSVSGWMQTFSGAAQRRKRQMMVAAGSVVATKGYPLGCMVDLAPKYNNESGAPNHPVYRSGFAPAIYWPK